MSLETNEKLVARNVTLTEWQQKMIEALRRQQGLESFSAALRWILHRWEQLDPAAPQMLFGIES